MSDDGVAAVLVGGAKAQADPTKIQARNADITAELTSMGWDRANFPIPAFSIDTLNGRFVASGTPDPETVFKQRIGDPATWPTLWVSTAGNDTTGTGASEATAFGSIGKAIQTANTAGVPHRVMVVWGYYSRNRGFSGAAGSIYPTVSLAFYAVRGRVVVTTGDVLTWAADATYPWVYRATRSATLRIVNLLEKNEYGDRPDFSRVADAASCSRVPDSWTQVGNDILVHRADGRAAADANTRVFMTIDNFSQEGAAQSSFLFAPADAHSGGFDFEGGRRGCFRSVIYGGTATALGIIAFKNCTMKYAGGVVVGSSTDKIDNLVIDSFHGLVLTDNGAFNSSSKDGINIHNNYGYLTGAKTYFLSVNTKGRDFGRGTSDSNNAWTLHDPQCYGVDICGDYGKARGSTFHIVLGSKAIAVGATCSDSFGDIDNGGTTEPSEFRAGDTSEMWIVSCTARPFTPMNNAVRADGDAKIYYRNSLLMGTQRITSGTASITPY